MERLLGILYVLQRSVQLLRQLTDISSSELRVKELLDHHTDLQVGQMAIQLVAVSNDRNEGIDRVYLIRVVDERMRLHDVRDIIQSLCFEFFPCCLDRAVIGLIMQEAHVRAGMV